MKKEINMEQLKKNEELVLTAMGVQFKGTLMLIPLTCYGEKHHAIEIAERSGIPVTQVRTALKRLEKQNKVAKITDATFHNRWSVTAVWGRVWSM